MSNLIDNIDAINREVESGIFKNESLQDSPNKEDGAIDINSEVITQQFLDAYPKPKPHEEIISAPINFKL